jgi:hypothetical protein
MPNIKNTYEHTIASTTSDDALNEIMEWYQTVPEFSNNFNFSIKTENSITYGLLAHKTYDIGIAFRISIGSGMPVLPYSNGNITTGSSNQINVKAFKTGDKITMRVITFNGGMTVDMGSGNYQIVVADLSALSGNRSLGVYLEDASYATKVVSNFYTGSMTGLSALQAGKNNNSDSGHIVSLHQFFNTGYQAPALLNMMGGSTSEALEGTVVPIDGEDHNVIFLSNLTCPYFCIDIDNTAAASIDTFYKSLGRE